MKLTMIRNVVLAGFSTLVFGAASAIAQGTVAPNPGQLKFKDAVEQFDSSFPKYLAARAETEELASLIAFQEDYCKRLDAIVTRTGSVCARKMLETAMNQLKALWIEHAEAVRIADETGTLAKQAVQFMVRWHSPEVDNEYYQLVREEQRLVGEYASLTGIVFDEPSDAFPADSDGSTDDVDLTEYLNNLVKQLGRVRARIINLGDMIMTAESIIQRWNQSQSG